MKELITIPIDKDLLIKILQKTEKKKGSISDLIQKFFKWVNQEETSLKFNSFVKRQPEQSLDDYLKAIEISEIKEVCYYANSKTDAADKLGISLRSLRYRLDRYRINCYEDDLKFK